MSHIIIHNPRDINQNSGHGNRTSASASNSEKPSLVVALTVDCQRVAEVLAMNPVPRVVASARDGSSTAPSDGGIKQSVSLRMRKPTAKAAGSIAISDDENDAPAAISKAGKVPVVKKARGSEDVYIGVLAENNAVKVHATESLTGPRTRIFHQDLPEGVTMESINVMTNGMVRVARVILDNALLTPEIMAKAAIETSHLTGDDTKASRAKMRLVSTYYAIVNGKDGRRVDEGHSGDEDVKVPKNRLTKPKRVRTSTAAKAKASVSDGEDSDGDKPSTLHVGWSKNDPSIAIYVKLSTHTQRMPYVLYVSRSDKLRGRLLWDTIKFMPMHTKSSADEAKEYFRSLLTSPARAEPDGSEEEMPAAKKRKHAEDEDVEDDDDMPAKPTARVARISGLRNSRSDVGSGKNDAKISANTKASRDSKGPRGARLDQAVDEFHSAQAVDDVRTAQIADVGGNSSLRKSAPAVTVAALPIAQMQDPDDLVLHTQNFVQGFKARVQGFEATIQKQKNELTAAQGVIRTQKKDLVSAQDKIQDLESQLAALNRAAPASIEVLGNQEYHRDGPLSANPGLLRRQEIGLFEWSGKTWKKEMTLRELELVVESDQDPIQRKAGGEIYQHFTTAGGGPEVMVCSKAETVVIDGHPFYQREVMTEVLGV